MGKLLFVPLPDNEDAFCAYVNLVINNRDNAHIPHDIQSRPKKIGWVNVTYTRNEVGEPFIVVENLKEKCFVGMILNQFCLLRSHWNMIASLEKYPNNDRL